MVGSALSLSIPFQFSLLEDLLHHAVLLVGKPQHLIINFQRTHFNTHRASMEYSLICLRNMELISLFTKFSFLSSISSSTVRLTSFSRTPYWFLTLQVYPPPSESVTALISSLRCRTMSSSVHCWEILILATSSHQNIVTIDRRTWPCPPPPYRT